MTVIVEDTVVVAAPPDVIRAMLHDPEALRRVLPGCESLEATGPDAYEAVLAVKIQFMSIRADVTATIDDGGPGSGVRLAMSGRPKGLAGSFRVEVPFELEPVEQGTLARYEIDLTVTGRLAAFGRLILRDATKRQIAALVRNVEHEANDRTEPA